jgi:hypothetical protein
VSIGTDSDHTVGLDNVVSHQLVLPPALELVTEQGSKPGLVYTVVVDMFRDKLAQWSNSGTDNQDVMLQWRRLD